MPREVDPDEHQVDQGETRVGGELAGQGGHGVDPCAEVADLCAVQGGHPVDPCSAQMGHEVDACADQGDPYVYQGVDPCADQGGRVVDPCAD